MSARPCEIRASDRLSTGRRYHGTNLREKGRLDWGCHWQPDCTLAEEVVLNMVERHRFHKTIKEESDMKSNYIFICGVMWCKFGQQEAGEELLRAAKSEDPDISALAWAMLEKGARRLKDLERRAQTSSRTILQARLCG